LPSAAVGVPGVLWNGRVKEIAMLRSFRIATVLAGTVSAVMMIAACKTDKPATPAPAAPAASVTPAASAKPVDPAAKPAAPAATNSELETRGIAMMQHLADVFAADGKDCDKLAADIKAFVADNKPLLTQLAALDQQQNDAQRDAFSARNAEVQAAVAAKMQGAMTACGANPGVLAAMKEFPGE
jgi:hypothetical protein